MDIKLSKIKNIIYYITNLLYIIFNLKIKKNKILRSKLNNNNNNKGKKKKWSPLSIHKTKRHFFLS